MEEVKDKNMDPLEQREKSVCKYQTLWNNEESDYILQLWTENVAKIRSADGFRSKKCLWEDISKKLYEKFGIHRSAIQCEGRLKTIQRREQRVKRKHFEDETSEDQEESCSPFENSHIPTGYDMYEEEISRSNQLIVRTLRETMLDINSRKEQEKDRRHREKMELLERYMNKEYGKNEQQQVVQISATMTMRERLLESHRLKMQEKERRHREKLELLGN